jgi:spore coat protein U-like protein
MFRQILAIAGLAACGLAHAAGTDSDTLQVTANVPGHCSIEGKQDIAFGAYQPTTTNVSTPLDTTGSITLRCAKGTIATINIQQGGNAATGSTCAAPARRMQNASVTTEYLNYDLYRDGGHATKWGCDSVQTFTSPSASVDHTVDVYGRVPAGQDAMIGNYQDQVTVDVTF